MKYATQGFESSEKVPEFDFSISPDTEHPTQTIIVLRKNGYAFEVTANLINYQRLTEAVTRATPDDEAIDTTNRLRKSATAAAEEYIEKLKWEDYSKNFK